MKVRTLEGQELKACDMNLFRHKDFHLVVITGMFFGDKLVGEIGKLPLAFGGCDVGSNSEDAREYAIHITIYDSHFTVESNGSYRGGGIGSDAKKVDELVEC